VKARTWFRRWLRRALWLAAASLLLLVVGERVLDAVFPYPVARLQALEHSTVLTAADDTWLQVWPTSRGERALPVRWHELSPHLRHAILVAEDERFFSHTGVDFGALLRAMAQDAWALRVVSGASTLTMQVVRMVEPRPRSAWAKLVEMFRARQLERLVGKQGVLDLWASQVPMGGTLRGVESAARYWFGKGAGELDAAEAAALVAMVPAPSARAPHRHPQLLRCKRNGVLARMAAASLLAPDETRCAMREPLAAERHPWPQQCWHPAAAAMAALPQRARPERLRLAVDLALQQRLEAEVGCWPELPGDGLAVVVLDRTSGAVRALVSARESQPGLLDLSRCRRSVGSTLKPFLYALAMDLGVLADASLLADAPMEVAGWRPANFGGGHQGGMRPCDALAASANLPAVRCLQAMGTAPFAEVLERLGLRVDRRGLGLDAALGTLAASPLELARAWQRFAGAPEQVGLSASSVYWTLRSLSVRAPAPGQVGGRIAWKSGTSSGCRDAWCAGVTEDRVLVVWLGNLDGRGTADLVGMRDAAGVLARVAAML